MWGATIREEVRYIMKVGMERWGEKEIEIKVRSKLLLTGDMRNIWVIRIIADNHQV